mgnify:CR=1 FL=1
MRDAASRDATAGSRSSVTAALAFSAGTNRCSLLPARRSFLNASIMAAQVHRVHGCLPSAGTPSATLYVSFQARGLGKFLFFRLHGFGYDVLKQVGGGGS